jgi:cytochrome d ubiquinol oxidase subunit I
MRTASAVSPNVDVFSVAVTLVGFTLVYAVLAVIEVRLLLKYIRLGPQEDRPEAESAVPTLSY